MATLFERDGERRTIDRALRLARRGDGSVLLLSGPAGIGKTALVGVAKARARAEGFRVLDAVGTPLGRVDAHGVARQLLLPAVATPTDRDRLLVGAAALAAPALGLGDAGSGPDATFAATHGLVWLAEAIVRDGGPALLCVDDAHWADDRSLRVLDAIAARARDLPLLVLVARRPVHVAEADPPAASGLVSAAESLALRPLTPDAVGAVLRAEYGRPADPTFVAALHRHTGGLPYLVVALAAAALRDGIPPDQRGLSALAERGDGDVGALVGRRLGALSADARAVASAVAIGAGERPTPEVARVARVTGARLDAAIAELGAAGLLADGHDRPRFAHALVGAAVLTAAGPGTVALLHARAADAAHAAGDVERAAAHLLQTVPAADDGTVATLRQAAGRAVARGASDAAAELFGRALVEGAPASADPQLAFEAGLAEVFAGRPHGVARLGSVAASHPDPGVRLRAALVHGQGLALAGRVEDGFAAMARAIDGAGGAPAPLLLRARLADAFARLSTSTHARAARSALDDLRASDDDPHGATLRDGVVALGDSYTGTPATIVAARARTLSVPFDPASDLLEVCAPLALLHADEFAAAREGFTVTRDRAARRGQRSMVRMSATWLAVLAAREGLPRAVEGAALDVRGDGVPDDHDPLGRLVLAGAIASAALDRGDLAATAAAADEPFEHDDATASLAFVADLLVARSHLRRAQGRADEAVRWATEAGRVATAWGASSAATSGWSAALALALAAADRADEAREAADDELADARRFGAPRPLARALRVCATVRGDHDLAREAMATARDAPALERARCGLVLGALEHRAGRQAEAREVLRPALHDAASVGADGPAEVLRRALVAAGGRPRRAEIVGVLALTAAEERTARLAAAGATNREIAETLFVTVATVEHHLTRTYRKLGVGGRTDLGAALRAAPRD